jgi:hypothetical protein
MSTEPLTSASSPEVFKPAIQKFTLSKLVAEYDGGIRIPMIQRDYAQGRPSWANPRNRFLEDLNRALRGGKPLHLDFVYGIKQGEGGTNAFCPLDGQQRLTTLFLLHWYLAVRDGCFGDFQQTFRTDAANSCIPLLENEVRKSKFTYQVRPGGRSFFGALVQHAPQTEECKTKKPKDWIRQQSWFRSIWERDPSVAGALEMLDAIHGHFMDTPGVGYNQLADGDRITFQMLDLKAVGLHDDLYLRMNARGQPLSTFETFKARFEKILDPKKHGDLERILVPAFPDESKLSRCKVKAAKDFSDRIDKEWLDFIWNHYGPTDSNSDNTSSVDDAFINLFRAVVLASLQATPEDAENRITKEDAAKKDSTNVRVLRDDEPDYDHFENGGWLTTKFTAHLIHVLEACEPCKEPNSDRDRNFILFQNPWFGEGRLLDLVVRHGGKKPDYSDFLQFAACVRFLTSHGPELNADDRAEFGKWNRVVRNLIVNSDVRAETFLEMLSGLDHLMAGSRQQGGILAFLAATEGKLTGFNRDQIKEEELKAKLILGNEAVWWPLIRDAENHRYFRGQIGFLLDFSKAKLPTIDHANVQADFRKYFDFAKEMFGDNGLREDPRSNGYLWQRALLAVGDYLLNYSGERWSLLDPGRNGSVTWKRFLQEDHGGKRGHLKELWDRLDINSLEDSLNRVLGYPIQKLWRKALCDTPKAWEYCGDRLILFVGKDVWEFPKAFLLSGTIRSAAYEELYSFCFRTKEGFIIHPPVDNGRFAPLKYAGFDYVPSSYHHHLKFALEYQGRALVLQLYCHCDEDHGFSLRIPFKELGEDREEITAFLLNLGFESELKSGDPEQNPNPWWLGEHLVLRQDPANPLDGSSFLESFAKALNQAQTQEPS